MTITITATNTADPSTTPPARTDFQRLTIPLAIRPAAMFEQFLLPPSAATAPAEPTLIANDQIAVVTVSGPLCQTLSRWDDSYEAIQLRGAAAFDSPARAVVLRINSPGGVLYGAIDTARALRAHADAAGKPLIAYVDGEAASAAYAIACAADQIILSTNAIVGSIGVLQCRPDVSQANAARGVTVAMITTGSRKAYGNPEVPLTDQEYANTLALVTALAMPFFDLVSARRGIAPEVVAAMDGGLFTGPAAITARLADRVLPFDAMIASLSKGQLLAMNYAEIIAGLTAMAEGDGEDATKARKMLSAAAGQSEEPKDGAEQPAGEDAEEAPAAEGSSEDPPAAEDGAEEPPAAEDGAEEKPAASMVSARTARDLAATVQQLQARLTRVERDRDTAEIARLLTGQPKALKDALRGKPLRDVRAIVAALPKPGRVAPITTLSSPEGTPDPKLARKPLDPVAAATVARINRLTGYVAPQAKRVTKLINGTLYFDVPEDYDPHTVGTH